MATTYNVLVLGTSGELTFYGEADAEVFSAMCVRNGYIPQIVMTWAFAGYGASRRFRDISVNPDDGAVYGIPFGSDDVDIPLESAFAAFSDECREHFVSTLI